MVLATSRAARLALAVAALAVLVALLTQLTALRGQDTDLYPRWYGLRQLLLHGRNPYGDDVSREIANQIWFFEGHVSRPESGPATPLESIYGFLYPLPGALLFAPLALLPYPAAFTAWLLCVLVALPASAWLAMDVSKVRSPKSEVRSRAACLGPAAGADVVAAGADGLRGGGGGGYGRLVAVPLALFFLPAWANVMLGQPAPAVAFLTALAVWLRPRPVWSGVAFAAACCVKPHLLALLAPLWLTFHLLRWRRGERRSARFLAGVGGAGALLGAASFLLLPSWLGDFARAARDYVAIGPGGSAALVALQSALPESVARPMAAMCTAAVLVWTLAAWRTALDGGDTGELRAIWRTVVATALVVPPAWETNAVMLLLPLAAALAALPARRAARFAATSAAITVALLPPYLVLGWQRGTLVIAAYVALLAAPRVSRAKATWTGRGRRRRSARFAPGIQEAPEAASSAATSGSRSYEPSYRTPSM